MNGEGKKDVRVFQSRLVKQGLVFKADYSNGIGACTTGKL